MMPKPFTNTYDHDDQAKLAVDYFEKRMPGARVTRKGLKVTVEPPGYVADHAGK